MKEKLIKRGAEAEIYLSKWLDRDVIVKKRIAKRYRNKELDRALRAKRIRTEAKLISDVRTLGISTPIIYDIDSMECKLTMEHVDGIRVKEILPKLSEKERKKLCNRIGRDIGTLHNNDIIHGDLTTSNMIVTGDAENSRNLPKIYRFSKDCKIRKLPKDYKVYFIDLSMGEKNNEIEAKGTDMHVLKEAFESTHSELDCFKYVLDGYKKEYDKANDVIIKIDEITKRGRYTN
ncbi:MAG: KEOPS complex kinase/ATPase Bud32 [Thermoplasmata archaeon]